MPTKPIDRKLKKREKITKGSKQTHETPVSSHSSVGLKQPKKKKGKTLVARRVLSLSIAAYLGYNFLLGCGSPLDQTSQKPAVCEGIDPIKLDLMALYQSEFYQHKVHPHLLPVLNTVTDYYDQYGAPQQAKLAYLYNQHGKPVLNKAHIMYQDTLLPKMLPYMNTCQIYLDQARIYADPYVAKATQKALLAQNYIQYQWHHALPPHVQRARDATLDAVKQWYERAEHTDMVPILLEFYWSMVDFMQYQCWPAIQSSHVSHKLKPKYDQYLKQYVEQHIKPFWIKYNDQVHLDQLLAHVLAVLPQRTTQQATAGSLMAQTKTSMVHTTTQDIPITQKVVTQPTSVETIGKYDISHDEDIVKQTSVASATKQVATENQVVPVPEEKELFEQNPVPPQSPTQFDTQEKEDILEQKIIKPVKENVEAVKKNAEIEKQVIEEKVEEAKKAADENMVKPLKQAKEQVMDHVEEAKNATKDKVEDVKEVMKDSAKEAKDIAEDKVVDIKQTVEDSTNEAKKQVKEAKEATEEKVVDVKENVQDKVEDAKENAQDKMEDVKENVQENVKKAKDTVTDAKEMAKEAKDTVEVKLEDIKETMKEDVKETMKEDVKEAKDMVQDKVTDAKGKAEDVKETVEDKIVHIEDYTNKVKETNEAAKDKEEQVNEAKDTIEPEVMKPIELNIKKPIKEYVKEPIDHYIKEPIQKVLKQQEQVKEPSVEDKKPRPKEQDTSPLTKEQVVVSDDASFVVQKEQPIAKDIPPMVIDQFVLEDEDEVVIDNEPIVPDDKSQFVK